MSYTETLKHNFRAAAKGDKINSGFPIQVQGFKQTTLDKNVGGYDEYVVIANGFVIAHFVDWQSMKDYIDYLGKFGFKQFPKKIMDILEAQHNSGAMKRQG